MFEETENKQKKDGDGTLKNVFKLYYWSRYKKANATGRTERFLMAKNVFKREQFGFFSRHKKGVFCQSDLIKLTSRFREKKFHLKKKHFRGNSKFTLANATFLLLLLMQSSKVGANRVEILRGRIRIEYRLFAANERKGYAVISRSL